MTGETTMKVFRIEDGETHWVIAADKDDAVAVMVEFNMADDYSSAEDYRDGAVNRIEEVPGDKPVTVLTDDGGDSDTRTAASWARDEGRGYLAGSCF